MNNEQNKSSETAEEFLSNKIFNSLNAGDIENFGRYFSKRILFKNPDLDEPITDIESFLEWWEEILIIWENTHWKLNSIQKKEDGSFVWFYTFTGTHFLTQKTVQTEIQANIKMYNDKIIEFENIFNSDDFIRQAGF